MKSNVLLRNLDNTPHDAQHPLKHCCRPYTPRKRLQSSSNPWWGLYGLRLGSLKFGDQVDTLSSPSLGSFCSVAACIILLVSRRLCMGGAYQEPRIPCRALHFTRWSLFLTPLVKQGHNRFHNNHDFIPHLEELHTTPAADWCILRVLKRLYEIKHY